MYGVPNGSAGNVCEHVVAEEMRFTMTCIIHYAEARGLNSADLITGKFQYVYISFLREKSSERLEGNDFGEKISPIDRRRSEVVDNKRRKKYFILSCIERKDAARFFTIYLATKLEVNPTSKTFEISSPHVNMSTFIELSMIVCLMTARTLCL